MSTTYGYARVSTRQQNLDRQIENIKREDPSAIIFSEQYTGTKQERPEWKKLLRIVRPGDTIIFDEVSRMSRNAKEGFQEYTELFNNDVELIFIKEPHINTTVYKKALETKLEGVGDEIADTLIVAVNKVLQIVQRQQIEAAFDSAQKEVDFLHVRISEGMKRAQAAGKEVGRKEGIKIETAKAKEKKEVIIKHSKTFGGSLDDRECMKLTGLSRNTYYKYKRELRETIGNKNVY